MILYRLKCHLLESTHIKKTKLIKYLIFQIFNEEIKSETEIYNTLLLIPSVFENLIGNENETLESILNEQDNLKTEGSFLSKKISYYEFNKLKSSNLLKQIQNEKGRLLLYENLMFHFPEYLEITMKLQNVLMNDSGFLSTTWRIYLAIMVLFSLK